MMLLATAVNAAVTAAAKIANAFEWPKLPPKIAPSLWDFVTLPEEDRATTIGNTHKKLVKISCGSGYILVDRQTHTHTQTYSSQYFHTPYGGKVTRKSTLALVTSTTSAQKNSTNIQKFVT